MLLHEWYMLMPLLLMMRMMMKMMRMDDDDDDDDDDAGVCIHIRSLLEKMYNRYNTIQQLNK